MAHAVTGRSSQAAPAQKVGRHVTFFHAVAFVLGFSLIFTFLFGPAAVLLGQGLGLYFAFLQKLGAILLVIFALITFGLFRWLSNFISSHVNLAANPAAQALVDLLSFLNGLLYTERRVVEMHKVKRGWGYASSVLMGMSFSAGWVPCIGPILASILYLATRSTTVWEGSFLLAVYSLGLGIPFLLTGLAFSQATTLLRRLNRFMNIVGVISGLFLLLVAWLLWTEQLQRLTTTFGFLNMWVFALEDSITANIGVVNSLDPNLVRAIPLAFIAGLISFISPCVLPLVPAYIGYLSGASLGNSAK